MKKILMAALLGLMVPAAKAEPAFDRGFVGRITADLYQAYREDGIYGVMDFEQSCWNSVRSQPDGAPVCALMMMTGIIIEGAEAQSQGRQPALMYNIGAATSRARNEMSAAGIAEPEFKKIMKGVIDSNETIVAGLFSAGMR